MSSPTSLISRPTRNDPPPGATEARFLAGDVRRQYPRRRRSLAPVRPSPALENEYRGKIEALIDEMENSVLYWLKAAYRKFPPEMLTLTQDAALAEDAPTPAVQLSRAIRRLQGYWQRRFDKMAKELAAYFQQAVWRRSDAALLKILRDGGIAVKFQLSPAMKDQLAAIVQENVALIRSIPRQSLGQVEQYVMTSVRTGRDLQQLTNDIQSQFAVSRNRARLIARDQNNKATGQLQRVRMLDNGITECIWVHSGAGKQPRPAHVKAGKDKIRFDLKTGWFDPHEKKYIIPGELINCRCIMRPVVPGFS